MVSALEFSAPEAAPGVDPCATRSGSILCIGSAGSILSIGSAGSILSIGSAGTVLAVGKADGSGHRPDRGGVRAGATLVALLALAAALRTARS